MNATHERLGRCPSRLRFDRLIARELNEDDARELERHAADCRRCGPVLAELRRGHEAFAPELPAVLVQQVLDRQARSPASRRRFAPLIAAPLLAAAALLVVRLGRPDDSELATRSKGGAQLGFYVLHDGVVRAGADGERVHPGDALRFAYSSSEHAYLAIISIDEAGVASTYYGAERAAEVAPGRHVLLDQSTVLDGALGGELVYGLLCPEPIALAPVVRALQRQPIAPPSVPGCTVERIALQKVPR